MSYLPLQLSSARPPSRKTRLNSRNLMLFALALSLLGGVIMWLSQPPRRAVYLQFFALTALLFATSTPNLTHLQAAELGMGFALGYCIPQLLELRLHPPISAALLLSQTLVWTLLALGAARFAALQPTRCALGVASWGALLMWLEWSILPLWGTAQAFARGWSRRPSFVQFASLTGVAGGVGSLFFFAALLARIARFSSDWKLVALDLSVAIVILGALNVGLWRAKFDQTLRVAAWGWADSTLTAPQLSLKLSGAVREAAQQGALLLVTPEAAFQVENRASFRESLRALALKNRIALAVGYFDLARQENCLDFVDASGEIQGRYVKTHLVPIFETYTRGRGEIARFSIQNIEVGGLICQDDNFADLAAKYGRAQTQILVIPTHDWAAVKHFHFVNSLWRSLEFRFGIVKAASGGISAIVSPRGEVLASCDHFTHGFQLLVADMPVGNAKITWYARGRDWFPALCALVALWILLAA